MKYNKLLDDKRAIRAIRGFDDRIMWTTNSNINGSPDKIEVYGEPGQNAYIPWFMIWLRGEVIARVNGASVMEVIYHTEEEI